MTSKPPTQIKISTGALKLAQRMRVSIITTIDHNVGDDFVREGILHLLEAVLGRIDVQLIHKHIPLTARPEWDWYYKNGWSKMLARIPRAGAGLRVSQFIDRLPLNPSTDKILTSDVIVQSGAPIYWWHPPTSSCADAEWNEPLLNRRWNAAKKHTILMNLAGGTCQRYHSDGSEFSESPTTLNFIENFYDKCALTTVRDSLSQVVLKMVDRDAVALPCTSIFARKQLGLEPKDPSFVALNYMPSGGHYPFGQNIDPRAWERTFVEFASQLAKKTKCILVCHNQLEKLAAERLLPNLEIFYSEDHKEMLRFYSAARYGIVNRVHAAFAIASYGRPSFIVGSDTRSRMAEMIGLKSQFVAEVTVEDLNRVADELDSSVSTYADHFSTLAEDAEAKYLELLHATLNTLQVDE